MVAIVGSPVNNQKNLSGTPLSKNPLTDVFDQMLTSAREDFSKPAEKNSLQNDLSNMEDKTANKASSNNEVSTRKEVKNTQENSEINEPATSETSTVEIENKATVEEGVLLIEELGEVIASQNTEEVVVEVKDDKAGSDLETAQVATFVNPQIDMEKVEIIGSKDLPELDMSEDPKSPEQQDANIVENSPSRMTEKPEGKFEISENDFDISTKQEALPKDSALQQGKIQNSEAPQDSITVTNQVISSKADDKTKSEKQSSDVGPIKVQVKDIQTQAHNSSADQEFDLNKDQLPEQIAAVELEAPEAEFIAETDNDALVNASNNVSNKTETLKANATDTEGLKEAQSVRTQALDAVKIVHNSPVAKTVTITLSPANLGHMTITLDIDPATQTSRINFTITNSKTYEMMLSTQETLRQELKEVVSISESSLQFNLKEGNGEENQSQKNAWHNELRDFEATEEDKTLTSTATASDSYTALDDLESGISRLV